MWWRCSGAFVALASKNQGPFCCFQTLLLLLDAFPSCTGAGGTVGKAPLASGRLAVAVRSLGGVRHPLVHPLGRFLLSLAGRLTSALLMALLEPQGAGACSSTSLSQLGLRGAGQAGAERPVPLGQAVFVPGVGLAWPQRFGEQGSSSAAAAQPCRSCGEGRGTRGPPARSSLGRARAQGTALGDSWWCLLHRLSPPAPPDGIGPGSGAGVAWLPRLSRAAALQKMPVIYNRSSAALE